MTHTELKQVILDYMKTQFQINFIGDIRIEDLDPIGYKVSFNLDHAENPFVLMVDFIKEELRRSKLHRVKYFKAIKIQPPEPKLCYDRQRAYR